MIGRNDMFRFTKKKWELENQSRYSRLARVQQPALTLLQAIGENSKFNKLRRSKQNCYLIATAKVYSIDGQIALA